MAWTDPEEWRQGQQTATVDVNHHTFDIAYREFGDGDPATVFLHGIPTWGFLFHDVCDAAEHAIVPDLPGYGYTQHVAPDADVDPFGAAAYDRSVRAQAEYMAAFLDELGHDEVQVVAHDIGGAVALRLAVLTDRVERLVLTNGCCYDNFPNPTVPPLGNIRETRAKTYQGVIADIRAKLTGDWDFYDESRPVDAFVDAMVTPYLDRARRPTDLARNAISLNTNHTLELVPHHDEIGAETLLLWGHPGDEQHTGYAERLAEDIPDATVETIGPSRHWTMFERPDEYRERLAAFLGSD